MKKLITLSMAVAIIFCLAIAVNAQKNNENGKWTSTTTGAAITTTTTTGTAITTTTTGAVISTTGPSLTFTPADTIDGLKAQIKENHKDKAIRKYLLKLLVQLRYKGGDNTIPVLVNGELIKFDVPPVIKSGRTLIPVRAVATALGADVDWDEKLPDIVTITKTVDKQVIKVVINLKTFIVTKSVDGATPVEVKFDVKPQLVKNRTVVPVRFIAEIFKMNVEYDPDTEGVLIDED